MSTHEELFSTPVSQNSPSDHLSGREITVLLVEDDRSLRRFLEVVLERAGYRVKSAGDGVEGMKAALSLNIDIVITDAIMPNLNGYELCRFLRETPGLSQIPIVLLSALEPVGSQRNEPIDAFLVKPVAPEGLLECLAGLLVKVR
ncbi:MAG TPA: response regulator [Pyrinomonadaceae bacterium]|nr:response regulator [Pyrinomonadaceae bacterium]